MKRRVFEAETRDGRKFLCANCEGRDNHRYLGNGFLREEGE